MKEKHNKVLALVTDAWGGTGGIAQYCRDFLEAVASRDDVSEVTVVPRVIARHTQPIPPKMRHVAGAAGSKSRFVVEALSEARGKPDLIICGHVNLLPVAWLAAKISGARVLLMTYGIEVWDTRGRIWQYLVKSCAGIVSISAFTLAKFARWAPADRLEVFLIPNAVDLDKYKPGGRSDDIGKKFGLSSRRPLLLTLGRMEASEQAKGFDEIIEILPALIDEFPDLQYCAAGDGNDRERLQEKARSLDLSERVTFPGYVAEEAKADLFRLADLYVMPSRLEGFGYVFLEALACGTPVVASSIDGSREAVRDGKLGAMVDPRDTDALLKTVIASLKNPFLPPRNELEYFSQDQFSSRVNQALDRLRSASIFSN